MVKVKGKNVYKAIFYWNAKVTKCKYQKQSTENKIKQSRSKSYYSCITF